MLVIGASGGVGSYAVQIAKALGAEVTGVASTGKLDLVRSWRRPRPGLHPRRLRRRQRHYDLVLDIAGNPNPVPAPPGTHPNRDRGHHRRRGGRLVLRRHEPAAAGSGALALRAPATDHVHRQAAASDLERLTDLIEAGRVTPSVDRTYPLHETADAMRHLAAGHARGKVAISI